MKKMLHFFSRLLPAPSPYSQIHNNACPNIMQNKHFSDALDRARKVFKCLANVAAATAKTRRSVSREFQTTAQETAESLAPRTVCVRRMTSFRAPTDLR